MINEINVNTQRLPVQILNQGCTYPSSPEYLYAPSSEGSSFWFLIIESVPRYNKNAPITNIHRCPNDFIDDANIFFALYVISSITNKIPIVIINTIAVLNSRRLDLGSCKCLFCK